MTRKRNTKIGPRPYGCLRRFVRRPLVWRNIAVWHWHEHQRRKKTGGFYHWMVRRHGKPEYGMGAWSWHVNGVLCSLWIGPSRLKIYHDGGRATKSYELTDPHGRCEARLAVRVLDTANVKWSEPGDKGATSPGA